MRYGSVCSGIEAATVAWRPLGWRCEFVAEIDEFASEVLKHRLPEVPNLGDFTKIEERDYGNRIDLLVGGSPCQSFSSGGTKGGIADPRGNLALEFARLAERARCRWVVWENVPAVLTIGGGRDFARILSEFAGWDVQTPADGWGNAGIVTNAPGRFGVSWRVLDARYTRVPSFPGAVPQRRRRVILVGHRGDWTRAAEVLLGGELCGGDACPRREAGVFAAVDAGDCASGECFPIDMMNIEGRTKNLKTKCYDEAGAAMYTLRSSHVNAVCTPTQLRRLLPVESERLMGLPKVVTGCVSSMTKDEYIAWLLMTRRIEVNCETGEVFSLRTGGGNPCLPRRLKGSVLNGYRVVSLREKDIKKQCRVHRVVWIARYGIIPNGYVVDHINNDKLDNRIENLQLLTAPENSAKAADDGLYPSGESNPATKLSDKEVEWIFDDYWEGNGSIRELSARFGISKSRVHQIVHSKGWTDIPWKGKEHAPDGFRHRVCGNSMCVNVMRWVGERIAAVEAGKDFQDYGSVKDRGDNGEPPPLAEKGRG